jgi:hypothetical protein
MRGARNQEMGCVENKVGRDKETEIDPVQCSRPVSASLHAASAVSGILS